MKIKKGIILAGGLGTRLLPLTGTISKHLIPINDRFIIDYPINTLKKLGCEHITIILGGEHFEQIVAYLKDGSDHGVVFNYVYQGAAKGIAQAIAICKPYVEAEETFAVILGDNIFDKPIIFKENQNPSTAKIILYNHKELERFGVASIDKNKIVKIEEKPKNIDYQYDNYAIAGGYIFNHNYFDYYKNIKPSARGEFEIVDIISQYSKNNNLDYIVYNSMWQDAGTFSAIEDISNYLKQNPVNFK